MRKRLPSSFVLPPVLILLLVALDIFVLKDSFAFRGINPHPFVVVAVFIGALYGLRPALWASILSSAAYLLTVHLNLNYQEVETLLDFEYLGPPLFLTMTAVLIGELRERNLLKIRSLVAEVDGLKKNEALHVAREGSQSREILELRKRLVSRLDATNSFYEVATSFHILDEKLLLENFTRALSELFKGAAVELYPRTRLESREVLDPLITEALRTEKLVTLKEGNLVRSANQGETRILLAVPVSVNDRFEFVAGVSRIPFLEYVPSQFRIAEIYASWIGSSIAFARTFRRSEEKSIMTDVLGVFRERYFRERLEEEFERSRAFMLPLTLLEVRVKGLAGLSYLRTTAIRKVVAGLLTGTVRKLDTVSETDDPALFRVMLPIADVARAEEIFHHVSESFRALRLRNGETELNLSREIRTWTPEMASPDLLLGLSPS